MAESHGESEQTPTSLRYGVFDTVGGSKKTIARLVLTVDENGNCNVAISSESDASAATIKELLRKTRKKIPENHSPEESLSIASEKLRKILTDQGYEVEVLPQGDHRFSFEIDMKTGKMIGSHEPLHEAISSDADDIMRRAFDSIAAKFKEIPNELATEIGRSIKAGSHKKALNTICDAFQSGTFSFAPTTALLDALESVDLDVGSSEQRLILLQCRLQTAAALKKYDIAGTSAEELLLNWKHTFTEQQICDLRMIEASAAAMRGSTETALMIWRELLAEPLSLGAANRGWAWRNISYALPIDDSETLHSARYSADAFLEAGDKKEAAKSLMQLANCLLHCEAEKALSTISQILPLLESDSLTYRSVRAATLHARADRLMKLGLHNEAAIDAESAANTWRGIMGAEEGLVSSLYLAAFASESAGNIPNSAKLKCEADQIAGTLNTSRFLFGNRLLSLMKAFTKEEALALWKDAVREDDYDVVASVRYVQASMDSALTDNNRLMLLEDGLNGLKKAESKSSMISSLQCAIGNQLVKMSQYKRARGWYEQVLAKDPLEKNAREGLLHCLWEMEAWGDAVLFLKSQLTMFGEMPGLLYSYGRSMYEAGDLSGAFRALKKVDAITKPESSIKLEARALAEKIFSQAENITLSEKNPDITSPVTIDELEKSLEHFGVFISNSKRMTFWNKSIEADYVWIEKPEQHGQNLLHTFLKARFQERIEVFEEVATGAGRLDIYIQLSGGLAAVIELKMCGFHYSSSYASLGEDQITHYMRNRRSSIGYLIVFDARLDKFESPFEDVPIQDSLTINTKFIDVRPRVSLKRPTRSKIKQS